MLSGQAAGLADQSGASAVAEVLPREDRRGGTRQDALAAQCSEQAVSSGGRTGLDDREGVAPRRPVSRKAVGAGTAQAEPTEPLRESSSSKLARHCAMAESWSVA